MISLLTQVLLKVIFLFKTCTGDFNVYHLISQETPPLFKTSGKMLKETKYVNSCCKSNWNTHMGGWGREGERDPSCSLASLQELPASCTAAALQPIWGGSWILLQGIMWEPFSETPICSLLRLAQVFSLGFLPFPRRWVRNWTQICVPGNPFSGCKIRCQPDSWAFNGKGGNGVQGK